LPSATIGRSTNYSRYEYAPPNCAPPARGILEALLGSTDTSPDPSLDLLDEARKVFGSHREIGCFVRCGQNDGRNRLNQESVDTHTRDEFRRLVDGSNYFRFVLNEQTMKDNIEDLQDRNNHARLAMQYRKLALAYMQEDSQKAKLDQLVPRLRFSA